MDFLIDPNVAYVLLVIGIMLGLLAVVTPGTGMFELGALFTLVLAGYAAYNLNLNAWAIVPLALAIVPFLFAFRYGKWRLPLLAATILFVIGGSIFLFRGEDDSLIGVNPMLAVIVSALYGGILWIMVDRTLVAMNEPVSHDPQKLIGQTGEARTQIHAEGSVQVAGELWSTRSEKPIAQGSLVRVILKDGFMLVVEEIAK